MKNKSPYESSDAGMRRGMELKPKVSVVGEIRKSSAHSRQWCIKKRSAFYSIALSLQDKDFRVIDEPVGNRRGSGGSVKYV